MACLGFERNTLLSTAKSLTVPAGTRYAMVQCETQDVRWRADGVNPTATVGMLLRTTDAPLIIDVLNAKFIETTASASINIAYFS